MRACIYIAFCAFRCCSMRPVCSESDEVNVHEFLGHGVRFHAGHRGC